VLLCIISPIVFAETIIVDAGQQDVIVEPVANVTNATLFNVTDNNQLNVNSGDLLSYMNNMTKRMVMYDEKFVQGLEAVMNDSSRCHSTLEEEQTARRQAEDDYVKFKEGIQSQIANLEIKLEREKWMKFIAIIITALITIFVMEYAVSITKRKKLYFKLRTWRENMPINPSLLFGGRK